MEEYEFLRPWGLTRHQIADKLGMQYDSLIQQLKRAAKAGDERSDWTPPTHVPSGTHADLQARRERAKRVVA